MPPKAKFGKSEIITAAVGIAEEKGSEYLTARSLAEKLSSSPRPIFTVFNRMDEVFDGVKAYANDLYQSYVSEGLKQTPAFKGVGTAYIKFASDHPKLFRLLFMTEHSELPSVHGVLGIIEDSYRKIVESITTAYGVGEEFAKELYLNMWIYSHGIAVLIATKMCKFGDEQISEMLTTVFKGLIIGGKQK